MDSSLRHHGPKEADAWSPECVDSDATTRGERPLEAKSFIKLRTSRTLSSKTRLPACSRRLSPIFLSVSPSRWIMETGPLAPPDPGTTIGSANQASFDSKTSGLLTHSSSSSFLFCFSFCLSLFPRFHVSRLTPPFALPLDPSVFQSLHT